MAYEFPHESRKEIYVAKNRQIVIREEDDCYGNGDQIILFSRTQLPQLIAWLQEIQTDIDAGAYDDEPETPTPEA